MTFEREFTDGHGRKVRVQIRYAEPGSKAFEGAVLSLASKAREMKGKKVRGARGAVEVTILSDEAAS